MYLLLIYCLLYFVYDDFTKSYFQVYIYEKKITLIYANLTIKYVRKFMQFFTQLFKYDFVYII